MYTRTLPMHGMSLDVCRCGCMQITIILCKDEFFIFHLLFSPKTQNLLQLGSVCTVGGFLSFSLCAVKRNAKPSSWQHVTHYPGRHWYYKLKSFSFSVFRVLPRTHLFQLFLVLFLLFALYNRVLIIKCIIVLHISALCFFFSSSICTPNRI